MAEEEDAATFFSQAEPLDESEQAEMPEWSGYLMTAWNQLRNDRHWGDMGGCSGMFYAAMSAYARDHGLIGEELDEFLIFLRVMDDEYVAFSGEQAKEAADRAKSGKS
ncbi:MAG: hypothetical protein K2Z25_21175 [Beijerinckiaceae bacterium]|nr:hypothetical protein [Beijerinckiaceae bacterium]